MENLQQLILNRYDDIEKDMAQIIAIDSVAVYTDDKEKPFGENVAKAVEWTVNKAKEMGLYYKVIENKVIYLEYGEGDSYDAVLAHFDIVPAGNGWKTNPFELTKIDGIYYARGIADDKGFGVVAMHCLKLFKDLNIKSNRRLRVILGFNEESGMEDMKAYLRNESLPEYAFTPDVEYTVCNREKGILQMQFTGKCDENITIFGGTVINAVAGETTVTLPYNESTLQNFNKFKDTTNATITLSNDDKNITIYTKGKPSHAMEPQNGINAIENTLLFMKNSGYAIESNLLNFIADKISLETDGNTMGVKISDEPSGELTLNLGNIKTENGKYVACIDIRYPVTVDGKKIIDTITQQAKSYGVEATVLNHKEPLYMPENHPFIQMLCNTYEKVTGKKAIVYSTGGGTYARSLKGRAVGFGGAFIDSAPTCVHTNAENISVADMQQHCKICVEAMYNMLTR